MILTREQIAQDSALAVAKGMVTAGLTAPKAHGQDHVDAIILVGKEKDILVSKMSEIYKETGYEFFERDSKNVDASLCVVLFFADNKSRDVNNCGLCGFPDCAQAAKAGAGCIFNTTDLGIAIGSAVSFAADHRVDTRVMFTAGKAALAAGLVPEGCPICFAIPISITSKSIFFDRTPIQK